MFNIDQDQRQKRLNYEIELKLNQFNSIENNLTKRDLYNIDQDQRQHNWPEL